MKHYEDCENHNTSWPECTCDRLIEEEMARLWPNFDGLRAFDIFVLRQLAKQSLPIRDDSKA